MSRRKRIDPTRELRRGQIRQGKGYQIEIDTIYRGRAHFVVLPGERIPIFGMDGELPVSKVLALFPPVLSQGALL